MAIVDNAFREWIADFKAANPSAADSRAILDTAQYAFAAGRKAQREIDAARQPVGQDVRAQFEAWAANHAMPLQGHGGYYSNIRTRNAYIGWRAALAGRQPVGEPVGRVMTDFVHWHGERPVAGTDLYAAQPAQAVDLGPPIPSELTPVVAALNRFDACAEDCDSEGCDIGRDWFDALTTIGLLKRTQRSPAVWTMTAEGERLLALIDSRDPRHG